MNRVMSRIGYSDQDFEFIREIMAIASGINLNGSKRELVYSRLAKRVRYLGFESFGEYCALLRDDDDELNHCVNAMTTNVTSFFRESHHFDFLKQVIYPEHASHSVAGEVNNLNIWSAGCSSGEEPYSVAISAREYFGDDPGWNININATDLDSSIVEKASRGIYRTKDVGNVDATCLRRWFHRGTESNEGKVRVVPEVRNMVTFNTLNLKHPWPELPLYDIIFCRNVMIYFDMQLKREVIEGFYRALKPGGYLFVGHSESLFGLSDRFEIAGKTIHRKRRALKHAG